MKNHIIAMASENAAIKEAKIGNKEDADQNNNLKYMNNNNENNKNQKLKYELPLNYKYEVHKCICNRPQKVFECGRCHHYFHGRISVPCKVHPMDIYLMDFRTCPYCFSSTTNVMESSLSWEQVRKIEDAQLPDDSD